jgi:hypothetical protein
MSRSSLPLERLRGLTQTLEPGPNERPCGRCRRPRRRRWRRPARLRRRAVEARFCGTSASGLGDAKARRWTAAGIGEAGGRAEERRGRVCWLRLAGLRVRHGCRRRALGPDLGQEGHRSRSRPARWWRLQRGAVVLPSSWGSGSSLRALAGPIWAAAVAPPTRRSAGRHCVLSSWPPRGVDVRPAACGLLGAA